MGRGAIEQLSHRPLRAVLAGLLSGGLFWLATNAALGRFGRRTE